MGVVIAHVIEASRTAYDFLTDHNFSSKGFEIGEKIRDTLGAVRHTESTPHKIETGFDQTPAPPGWREDVAVGRRLPELLADDRR